VSKLFDAAVDRTLTFPHLKAFVLCTRTTYCWWNFLF